MFVLVHTLGSMGYSGGLLCGSGNVQQLPAHISVNQETDRIGGRASHPFSQNPLFAFKPSHGFHNVPKQQHSWCPGVQTWEPVKIITCDVSRPLLVFRKDCR